MSQPARKEEAFEETTERRDKRRVPVNLRVAVVLGRDTAYMARSVDVSEGGIRLEDYTGPPLRKDRLVMLSIRGVISDATEDEVPHYLVRVVRHKGSELALRFVSE